MVSSTLNHFHSHVTKSASRSLHLPLLRWSSTLAADIWLGIPAEGEEGSCDLNRGGNHTWVSYKLGCPPSQDASHHQDYETFLGSGIPN